jgi:hypothetical protein
VANNKRMVPILYRPVPDHAIPRGSQELIQANQFPLLSCRAVKGQNTRHGVIQN